MRIEDSMQALPGKCKMCGTSDPGRGPFLDTYTSEEFHGAVYYCKECVTYMASLFGFISYEVKIKLEKKIDELEFRLVCANNELKVYKSIKEMVYNVIESDSVTRDAVDDVGSSGSDVFSNTEREIGLENGEERLLESADGTQLGELQSSNDSSSEFKLSI